MSNTPLQSARGLNGSLRFDGQTVEVFYDADEFGESKVRAADIDDLSRIVFEPAGENPGFVKFLRREPIAADERMEFGLRFETEQEADIKVIGKLIEAQHDQQAPIRDARRPNWTEIFFHNDKPIVQRWWVWLIGFFALGSVAVAVDPEGVERRAQERDELASAADAEDRAERAAAASAEAEDRRKGFHCLSGWDGSNRSFVTQVERAMRNPDSFEHVETRISPVNEGEHGVWMTFRAENGFGGLNVERMYARIDHESCAARVLPDGPGG